MFSKIKSILSLGGFIQKFVKWSEGKKTITGLIGLILWVMIYAVPTLMPELVWVADIGNRIKDILISVGLNYPQEILASAGGLTVIGLLDKFRRIFKES